MAQKKASRPAKAATAKTAPDLLKLGDQVEIRYAAGLKGRIVELRGPLGPNGAQIYRVRVRRKPKPKYIELRADQLIPIPAGNCRSTMTPRHTLRPSASHKSRRTK